MGRKNNVKFAFFRCKTFKAERPQKPGEATAAAGVNDSNR